MLFLLQLQVRSRKSLCPGPGFYPYENDCSRFYRCKVDRRGKLEGFLYECPAGYAFWEISKRCEKIAKVPACSRGQKTVAAGSAPIENRNVGSRKIKFRQPRLHIW